MSRPPGPPGSATDRNARVYPWKQPAGIGWQHGPRPAPPRSLKTAQGKKAWQTWLGSWWAGFYSPDDLPGLYATAELFEKFLVGAIDMSKVKPMLDAYGITPEGRQKLRWAPPEPEDVPSAGADKAHQDQLAAKRDARAARGVG